LTKTENDSANALIERLLLEGERDLREAAVVGVLESIQNACSHDGTDPERIGKRLLPESRRWWNRLNAFWSGHIDPVGADAGSG
jgi:hypothetical protein